MPSEKSLVESTDHSPRPSQMATKILLKIVFSYVWPGFEGGVYSSGL